MKNKFYITTAIPYINAAPHIGHALEFVQTDVIARWHRLQGDDVRFLSGTDDNSLKNVLAAENAKVPVAKYVDKQAAAFEELAKTLKISNDDFIRTVEKRHVDGCIKLWKAVEKDIYKKPYTGQYCVGCEEFKRDDDLVDGCCPEHPNAELQKIEEENYFFALSKYQDQIEKLIQTDEYKITPVARKNEVLAFVRGGLEDFSISRSKERARGWGIPVPGDDSQVMYVWFDALANYLTATGYATDSADYKKYWPADLHVVGKGIIKFHAIYWPAMLLAAGEKLPKGLFAHGYITVEGQKMSKSIGNVLNPVELIEKYGLDPFRYIILKNTPTWQDGDFSIKRFEETYNADLANGIGNLVNRVSTMVERYLGGAVPTGTVLTGISTTAFDTHMENLEISEAAALIPEQTRLIDQYIEETKPWELAKFESEDLAGVLGNMVASILEINKMLEPIVPDTAKKVQNTLGGKQVGKIEPLFPRLEIQE
jgi:methionyl-tRNA synthetase